MSNTNKYENACIYKISCKDESIKDCYIGSTINFNNRLYNHKSACHSENKKQLKLYTFINSNGGWFNFNKEIIESYPCSCKKELERREGYYIRLLNPTLNCHIAGRTDKQYYEDNKQLIKLTKKQYYEDNKDKLNAYKKEWWRKNKEYYKQTYNCGCGSTITTHSKTRHMKSKKHIKFIENQNT